MEIHVAEMKFLCKAVLNANRADAHERKRDGKRATADRDRAERLAGKGKKADEAEGTG